MVSYKDPTETFEIKQSFLKEGLPKLKDGKTRWIVLFFSCITAIGPLYCIGLPVVLQHALMDALEIHEVFQYNVIHTVYAVPNFILPFFGGVLVDRLGLRLSYIIFVAVALVGQAILTFGVANRSFILMLVGRSIFSIGGDSLIIAKSTMLSKWFMGKELAFALGIGLGATRIGSSLNSLFSAKIFDWTGSLGLPFLIGTGICFLSFISVFSLNILDKKADEQEDNQEEDDDDGEPLGAFNLRVVKKLKPIYYYLTGHFVPLYAVTFVFIQNLSHLLEVRFGFSDGDAGQFMAIIFGSSIVTAPFFGWFIDKKGKKGLIMIFAALFFLGTHAYIAFIPDARSGERSYYVVGGLISVGIFLSLYSAIYWPCVALIVPRRYMGVAYGLSLAGFNLMLSIIPLAIGKIHDLTTNINHGYFWTEVLLMGITGFGVIFTILAYIEDIRKGKRKLDKPSAFNHEIDTSISESADTSSISIA